MADAIGKFEKRYGKGCSFLAEYKYEMRCPVLLILDQDTMDNER